MTIASIGAWGVMLLLLAAGLLKLADLHAFAVELRTWSLVPQHLASPLAIIVAGVEVVLGIAWILGLFRPWLLLASVAWLSLLTVAYISQWVLYEPPACWCLGKAIMMENAWLVVIRNVVLMICSGLAYVVRPLPRGGGSGRANRPVRA